PLGRDVIDLEEGGSVRPALTRQAPHLVINAAAYNFVDRAEDETERAFIVNARGPWALARACAARDIPLVHVSSDYVFGRDAARTTPYLESDVPGPESEYARGKLAGE